MSVPVLRWLIRGRARRRAIKVPTGSALASGPNKFSNHGPSLILPPTLRANPYPEVTDPFCRLPLSTLFYQLEAVNLGDLLRLSVRLGEKHSSCGFSRAVVGAPDAVKHCALPATKPPLRIIQFRGHKLLEEKENSFQGPRQRLRSRLRCRENTHPSSGILTGFPFGRPFKKKES